MEVVNERRNAKEECREGQGEARGGSERGSRWRSLHKVRYLPHGWIERITTDRPKASDSERWRTDMNTSYMYAMPCHAKDKDKDMGRSKTKSKDKSKK